MSQQYNCNGRCNYFGRSVRKKKLSESIVNIVAPAEVALAPSLINLAGRYKQAINNADLDAARELGLTGIIKYQRHAGQVEMKLDWLYYWIPALVTFMKHSCKVYDNEEVTKNLEVRQNINPELVSSFFIPLHESILS